MGRRCQKQSFHNEAQALAARRGIKRRKERVLVHYKCEQCGKWHLGNTKATRVINMNRILDSLAH